MIVDGETYACEACIRGHRARSCDHHGEYLGRPLQSVRKKGRPASQCGHCRSMRKSRSAHVKCDCGKRARDAEMGRASPQSGKCELQAVLDSFIHFAPSLLTVSFAAKCNCFEDGKCKCAFKQEPLALVTVPQANSDDGTSTSVPSIGDSACGWEPDTLPSSSLLAFEEPGHFDGDAWLDHGLFQLDQEHAHHVFNDLGTGWDGSLVHAVGEDPQGWGSSTYHELNLTQPPLELHNVDGLGPSHSTSFDGFPGTTQDMLDAGLVATSVNWAPGEPGLPNSHNQDQIVSSAEPMWFEGPDRSTIAASTFREQAADESATASGDLTRGAAPE
ncbi:Copper resistance protein CRF1 [Tolypocladium ophioglossoides CBS 100239]|uniref:Copper resistance protein CRF1 n=1 Tax=Tolypocladium ophioglossoides (strain CBS 100239) TaxID=1163406 RepID=A0A0L0N1B5_TOLOC|nr:Copper resistance protein CRF1 [Tolypocladium ophioglossoides CBS 100239]